MESCLVALPALFSALTVNVDVPAVVGIPLITPVLAFSVRPPGKLPALTLHVIEAVPVAARVWLYAVPTVPSGRLVVVMVGAVALGFVFTLIAVPSRYASLPVALPVSLIFARSACTAPVAMVGVPVTS